jgi:hypothetical protein
MIPVPGVGDVPVIWTPAVLGADASYGRNGKRVLAIVHHRIVGTLISCIGTFTAGNRNRPVSTTFGIGIFAGKTTIAQFVDLRDTAYGNGNYDPSGRWDDYGYPLTEINARTVSIEHEDGSTANRGVVSEATKLASIELDRLLLSGNLTKIRAAGIRATGPGGEQAVRDLGAIVVGPRTILKHWDIAGRLKPYCWNVWLDDPGFPLQRYLAALSATPAPPEEEMRGWVAPKVPTVAAVKQGANLYEYSDFRPGPGNVENISPGPREMPYYGFLPGPIRIVEYVDGNGVHSGRALFARDGDVSGYRIATTPADPATVATATLTGRRSEWDRQRGGATVALLPKP